mmetsp:Transcript_58280/g.155752  ORF Transcript_58280/g.155752 Transcript_58280/m.155752 type:complete len:299 (+) Transcript_58280:248-1144(+)
MKEQASFPFEMFWIYIRRYTTERHLAGALFFIMAAWWNCCVQVLIDKWNLERPPQPPVYDLGWALLPHIAWPYLADLWNGIMMAGSIPLALFHREGPAIVRRFFLVQGTMFWLRSFSIAMTLLPPPYEQCENIASSSEIVALEALKIMAGKRWTCGDILYSGHTVNMTIAALAWNTYCTDKYLPKGLCFTLAAGAARNLWCLLLMGGYFVIVATHFHYSVDVFIGSLLTTMVWVLYHSLCVNNPAVLDKMPAVLKWYELAGEHTDSDDDSDTVVELQGMVHHTSHKGLAPDKVEAGIA